MACRDAKAVLRFYMAADVVLVASLNEVLPLVICESMAFERPVVCSALADGWNVVGEWWMGAG